MSGKLDTVRYYCSSISKLNGELERQNISYRRGNDYSTDLDHERNAAKVNQLLPTDFLNLVSIRQCDLSIN